MLGTAGGPLLFHQDFVCHMLILYFWSSGFSIFREINIENFIPNKYPELQKNK